MKDEIVKVENTDLALIEKEEYLGISDQDVRDEKAQAILVEDINIASSVILDEIVTLNKKDSVNLQELTDIYFDSLINNITDENLRREIAFAKNKITYIIQNT
jgi:uncharacterized protein YprB with RNaseH-like and TPR domain